MTSKNKKKILFVSGKRGGFDAMLPLSKLFIKKRRHKYRVILTDQHLNKQFGSTHLPFTKILGNKNIIKINTNQKDGSASERLKSFSRLIIGLSKVFKSEKPDLVVLYGDRCESLISAIVCLNFSIPICHFQGGDLSGNIDEKIRHSLSKLSDIHFVSNKLSKKRLKFLAENPKNIFTIGDSHIDSLKKVQLSKKILKKNFNLKEKENYCVLLFHPDGTSLVKNKFYINQIIEALQSFDMKVFCIYPCSDIGYQPIVNKLELVRKKFKNFKVFKNIPYEKFINLVKFSKFLIGNSSSGIIESAYLKTPVINLGNRQKNRLKSSNVIDCLILKNKIKIKIKKILITSKKNKNRQKNIIKYYGNGTSYLKAYKTINKKIKEIDLNKKFYEKR